ncbi:LysR family transcriptional regulator [uncultured Cohaesibacter sp.]|uniref:LysR family transcriptional regulator n=1 Tax=uncultured Cohaesibacter sp. TaxID=1002546 RepID=UPI0029C62247|nr:LysR family transcriptional regulator [uncultured Cohaesibacter sp.]
MARNLTRSDLGDLNLFRRIAEAGGFRKAAKELDMTPSALSHAMRGLEERTGVRLFNRTNRSMTLTPAGEDLLKQIQTGFAAIENGLEALNQYRDRPAGHLRLNVPTDAAHLVLAPILSDYTRTYPDVRLEMVIEDRMVDIVKDGFDAGIRYGDAVQQDMIAIPLGPDLNWIMVASPDYLERFGAPEVPSALNEHQCIGMRMGNGALYHWELEREDEVVVLNMEWHLITNQTNVIVELALTGTGIAYVLEARVKELLEARELVQVLPEWSSMGPAFYLYYPSRRQLPEALRALMEMAKNRR